jgi:ADP-heptose:LPS heptosyltransferase
MFGVGEWTAILLEKRAAWAETCALTLLGGREDAAFCEALRESLEKHLPDGSGVTLCNAAGTLAMRGTLARLEDADILYCIDSGLLHLARLLGLATESYWGPTAPSTLLRDAGPPGDVLHYAALPCSPCVHMAGAPPCRGNNLCMQKHVPGGRGITGNPAWLDPSSARCPARKRDDDAPR